MSGLGAAKSPSDSAVTVKAPSHSKAVSDSKLELQTKDLKCQQESHNPTSDSMKPVMHVKDDEITQDTNSNLDDNDHGDFLERPKSKASQFRSETTGIELRQRKSNICSNQSLKSKTAADSMPSNKKNDDNLSEAELKESIMDEEAIFAEEMRRKDTRTYYICWMILTLLSLFSRLHNIEAPAHVCWDETHFGKMGSWYINRTFFFDVHPPLGKMLIGLAGRLTGYDGSFKFEKPGDPYGDTEYVGMRMFCAVLGAMLVPLAYQCVWLLTHSILAAMFAGVIIISDTGMLALSRHILLDPILMFFIMLSTYCCLKTLAEKHRPFTFPWWFWISATGVSLASAIGVKFVGLFVVLFVGFTTAADLWGLLGNLSVSMKKLVLHVLARAACLIVLPVIVYCLFFAIHFKVLNRSGGGDGFFSSAFQSQLLGNRLYNVSMPRYVAYGSVVTLKQRRTGGAYLHSHFHLYPEEHPPKQQQVTTYSHKDENNRWLVKPADRDLPAPPPQEEGGEMVEEAEPIMLHSGDLIRLEHVPTKRNLHSHREIAPLTRHHHQVSCYGQNGSGDANDIWVVEVVGGSRGDMVETVRSRIRLVHYHVGCLLYSHDKKLPKWGWEQMEVTCQPDKRDSTAAWNVEEVVDSRLPDVNFDMYSPTFVEKLIKSHAVMTQGNRGLKPKEGEITSQPWQWPLDYRGQMFSGPDHRVYMLGNPIIFWWLLGSKFAFLLLWLVLRICKKRGVAFTPAFHLYSERILKVCFWLLLGWFLHYAPFWTMTRVLYFHHYFPAFLYSAMFGGVMLDFLLTLFCISVPTRMARYVFTCGLTLILTGIAGSLYLFHPLVYGIAGPNSDKPDGVMHGLKWLHSWDF